MRRESVLILVLGVLIAIAAWTVPAFADVSLTTERASSNIIDQGVLGSLLFLAVLGLVAMFILMRKDKAAADVERAKYDTQILNIFIEQAKQMEQTNQALSENSMALRRALAILDSRRSSE